MQFKKQLVEFFNNELSDKSISINTTDDLLNGYLFLELIHNFHSKQVDLSKAYIKPKNDYEILQNFKLIQNVFGKLGWKKIDPEKYLKKRQQDIVTLAQFLKKTFTSHSLKEVSQKMSHPENRAGNRKGEDEKQSEGKVIGNNENDLSLLEFKNVKISQLQKQKASLLKKIMQVEVLLCLGKAYANKEAELECIEQLRVNILDVVENADTSSILMRKS